MIRPGLWPRGKRPFTFEGEYFGENIPGVVDRNGKWFAPADAAWIMAANQLFLQAFPAFKTKSVEWPESSSLYDYQRKGVDFLVSRDYAILGDEMGLGKTVQALTAAEARLGPHALPPGALILCPALAKRHWAREVRRWTGCEALILDGLKPDQALTTSRYVIANYDILYGQRRKDATGKLHDSSHLPGWAKTLSSARFPIVICDEAHMLRGAKSRRTNAVKEVAKNSTCVWMLTGTPMPNHVRDLWALWDICSDGLAGHFWPWAKAYAGAYKGEYGWVADGRSRLDELQKRVSFFMLARSKVEVGLQLPEKRREMVQVDVGPLPPDSLSLDMTTKTNAVASALRRTAKAKREAVTEMAREALDAGQKVVVFVYLREQAEAIAKAFGNSFLATGAQSPEQRDILAQAFREHDGPAVFVATIDSVGVAISLVGADLVIFGDLSWEPAKLLQAEGRAHRHGSTNRVLVRYVIASGTIDEDVAESVVDKLATIEEAIGTTGDAADLGSGLALGRAVTTEAIIDSLFAKLAGGVT